MTLSSYATDINDTGQSVGLFGDATGEHGFIATPVPPSFAAFTATLKLKFGRRINDAFDPAIPAEPSGPMTTVSDALAFRKQRCENTPLM